MSKHGDMLDMMFGPKEAARMREVGLTPFSAGPRATPERKTTAQRAEEPGHKLDAGKPAFDLVAPEFVFATATVLTYGANKYAPRNWEKGMSWGRCFAGLMRHLWAWWRGEEKDPETGFSHLWHAACCLMFLIAYEERKTGNDDRWKGTPNAP